MALAQRKREGNHHPQRGGRRSTTPKEGEKHRHPQKVEGKDSTSSKEEEGGKGTAAWRRRRHRHPREEEERKRTTSHKERASMHRHPLLRGCVLPFQKETFLSYLQISIQHMLLSSSTLQVVLTFPSPRAPLLDGYPHEQHILHPPKGGGEAAPHKRRQSQKWRG